MTLGSSDPSYDGRWYPSHTGEKGSLSMGLIECFSVTIFCHRMLSQIDLIGLARAFHVADFAVCLFLGLPESQRHQPKFLKDTHFQKNGNSGKTRTPEAETTASGFGTGLQFGTGSID